MTTIAARLLQLVAQGIVALHIGARLTVQGEGLRRLKGACRGGFAVRQPVQKVQDVRLCRRSVAERQLDGAQHRLLIVVQNERQDLHHLPVAAGVPEKMLL